MFWGFLIILFGFFSVSAHAQSTLFYDLLLSYQPLSLIEAKAPQIVISPTLNLPIVKAAPSTSPNQVLGISTENLQPLPAHVGGEGKIITIAVLGDSMIDTMGKDLPTLSAALALRYPTVKFNLLNYGFGASNMEHGIHRLNNSYTNHDQNHPSLLSQKPNIVVIESFAYNNYGNTQSGYDRQWREIGTLIDSIKKTLPNTKILLAAAPAPNSVNFAEGTAFSYTGIEKLERTKTIKLYLQNLVNYASSQKYPLADAYHPSLAGDEGNHLYISPTDHLHLSPKGISFFANTIAQAIVDHSLIN